MYDPVERARQVAEIVCRGEERKYHRFRAARFYGGIATADCVGCCLACVFCWAGHSVAHPGAFGRFYTPAAVAEKLVSLARKHRYRQVRISGNEPTICRAHLLKVLERIPEDFTFILETNGILIGHDPSYAQELARFPNLSVRVSLKGTTEAEFSRLTGAVPGAYALQFKALAHLDKTGVQVHPAVMVSFSPPEHIGRLRDRLATIHPRFADFEVEELVLYGDVKERLERAGIGYRTAYAPRGVPPEQV